MLQNILQLLQIDDLANNWNGQYVQSIQAELMLRICALLSFALVSVFIDRIKSVGTLGGINPESLNHCIGAKRNSFYVATYELIIFPQS